MPSMHLAGRHTAAIGRNVRRFCALLLLPVIAPACAVAQQLHVSNPLDFDRSQEVIELPLQQISAHLHMPVAQLASLSVRDARTDAPIPTQLYGKNGAQEPDTLLLLVQLPAHGSVDLKFDSDRNAAPEKPLVFGRAVPERKDDFAWENEDVAYRMYGPALEATGEISSGIDVWSKRIPHLVVNDFYRRDHESAVSHNPNLSYHKDDGVGQDSYDVGPSRGCGGTGIWSNDKLYVSKNYTSVHILANGPIRFEFEVTYAPWQANGRTVSETKRILLDAGSHMNRITSIYTFDGDSPLELAAGLAIHDGALPTVLPEDHIGSVWDTPQDPSAGRIATGLVSMPEQGAKTVRAANHVLMLFTRRTGAPFTYFAGSGWSKADMPTADDWNAYLERFLKMQAHPLRISWTHGSRVTSVKTRSR
jgi:hypothetical protein